MIRVDAKEYRDGCMKYRPATGVWPVKNDSDIVIQCDYAPICEHVAEFYKNKMGSGNE